MNRATQIRQKRTLVTLAVSHRVLSERLEVLAEANQEARAVFLDGLTRVPLSTMHWEEVALRMFRALEAPLELEEEVARAREA